MARILMPTDSVLTEASNLLRSGGLVAFPTETVYGLGANALDAEAVAGIFRVKGRPATNPVIVHIGAPEEAELYAVVSGSSIAASFQALTQKFWPGPLTIVLPKRPCIPEIVTAGGSTVGLRVPQHPVALALLQAAGLPLAAPSANRSEGLSPTRAQHVATSLGDDLELILDGGATEVGLESTVVDLSAWPPRLLRPGGITVAQIEEVLGITLLQGGDQGQVKRSPGQMHRHYSPRTPLHLVNDIWAAAAKTPNSAVVAFTPPPLPLPPSLRTAAILSANPQKYGGTLYDTLHRLDSLNPSVILVEAVPETAEWLAVRDRLSRAAAP